MHFFVGAHDVRSWFEVAFWGSSQLAQVTNLKKVPERICETIHSEYPSLWIQPSNEAVSGTATVDNKLAIFCDKIDRADHLLVFDVSNDGAADADKARAEAFLRMARTYKPQCRLLLVAFPTISEGVPVLTGVETYWFDLCDTYEADYIDVATPMAAAIDAGPYTIDDFYDAPDYAHPNVVGQEFIADLVATLLAAPYLSGATQWSGTMPDRVYPDSATYEIEC